jgi:hypothetical protein
MLHNSTGSFPLDLSLNHVPDPDGALIYLYPGDASYVLQRSGSGLSGSGFDSIEKRKPFTYVYRDIPELMSAERKYLIFLYREFYHIFVDTLPLVLKVVEADPNAHIVFHTFGEDTDIRNFMLRLFSRLGIKYTHVAIPDDPDRGPVDVPICRIRNFSYYMPEDKLTIPGLWYTLTDVMAGANLVLEQSTGVESGILPYRKVYLSRSKVTNLYRDDVRVSGESVLEEYFAGLGYEICYPEDFSSFQEQVDFMSEVKVLVAPTGSGLINQLMMPSGGVVVELRCEMVFAEDNAFQNKQMMADYPNFAYIKGHTYIAVPNPSRSASEAIAGFEKLKI